MSVEFSVFAAKYPLIAKVWTANCKLGEDQPESFVYDLVPAMDRAEEFAAQQGDDLSKWAEDEQDDCLGDIIMSLGMGLATYKR